jgi:hypothetical protein
LVPDIINPLQAQGRGSSRDAWGLRSSSFPFFSYPVIKNIRPLPPLRWFCLRQIPHAVMFAFALFNDKKVISQVF